MLKVGISIWGILIVLIVIEQQWLKGNQLLVCQGKCIQAQQELKDIVALDSFVDSRIIKLARHRVQYVENKKKNTQKGLSARFVSFFKLQKNLDAIEKSISIRKKQIASYSRDVQDYHALEIAQKDEQINFAYKNIAQLRYEVINLEQQAAIVKKSAIGANDCMNDLMCMITANQRSVDQYKYALYDFKARGIAPDADQVVFARNQLERRLLARNAFESLLD